MGTIKKSVRKFEITFFREQKFRAIVEATDSSEARRKIQGEVLSVEPLAAPEFEVEYCKEVASGPSN